MDETTEQIPAWADALGKRFDEVCSRLDALENKGGDSMPTAALTADAAGEVAAAEHAGEKEVAHEKAAEHQLAEAVKEGEAEHRAETRADAAEQARLDSEEAVRKEREDKERKDSEEAKMRADAQLRNENAEMKKQIDAMNATLKSLTTPLSVTDRDQLSAAQARWDSVAQMFGDSVPAPLHGESPLAYRQRLAAKFQKHSDKFKGIRLDSLDGVVFDTVEEQIRMDAQAYAKSPAVMPAGRLIPTIRLDSAGRQITEYHGDMDVWLNHFKHHGVVAKVLRQNNGAR